MRIRFAILSAALLLGAAAKKDETPIDPGPVPNLEQFHEAGKTALLASLVDPSSATITWDRGLVGGYWKPPLSRKIPGWWTCGLINAKNRMGGYVGFQRFVVVMFNGSVVFTDMDSSDAGWVGISCGKAISQGMIPPAREVLTEGPSTSPALAAPSIADELEKLAKLKESGAITPSEYDAAKAKLLGR